MAKHEHAWDIHGDQYDVGNNGVRMFCKDCSKVLVFPREKVEQMTTAPPSSTDSEEFTIADKTISAYTVKSLQKLVDETPELQSELDAHDQALKDQLYEQLMASFRGKVEPYKTDGEREIIERLYTDFTDTINAIFGKGEQK